MHSVETVLCILNLDLFPGKPYAVGMILSRDARQRAAPAPAAPSQPRNHEGKLPIYLDHSAPILPFCFSFSVQYAINYMRFSTFCYKIGFMLDDLEAKVSFLSTLLAKL